MHNDKLIHKAAGNLSLLKNIYHNKKVLVTGNTGFKGSWLTAWLLELGAEVYGMSNGIPTNPAHFKVARLNEHIHHFDADIRNSELVNKIIHQVQPDFVFHLAAQALVRLSYREPLNTLNTNIMGTAHILEALRSMEHPCNAVIITSDKCYDNVEWTWGYRENDSLGGKDPYSASKGAAELVIRTYANSYFADKNSPVKIVSARAGNVIGGGDWAEDRIVPDCMKAWSQKKVVEIRSPGATRPWQHVLEPLSGYLSLGERLAANSALNGESFNFGPSADQNHTVGELIEAMEQHWKNIQWKDVSGTEKQVYEAGLLKLCCDKALSLLNWKPALNFQETVRLTVNWYRNYYEQPEADIFMFTRKQIKEYVTAAQDREVAWTKS
jgi:CDP-glucose 4,6-dehydratase